MKPKLLGEWAELVFMARALEHGLTCSRPWGECSPFDVLVSARSRHFRVQIKCTATTNRAPNCFSFPCFSPSRYDQPYGPDDIDFLACYIVPLDLWYIIPVRAFYGRVRRICLRPGRATNRYEPFRDAWHLFKKNEQERIGCGCSQC